MATIDTKGIILMGGSGSRFGSSTPKQFHRISGKKIYLHTLERFLASGFFEQVILVCHPDWIMEVQKETELYHQNIAVVPGGKTRQESSYLGLLACTGQTEIVVIHDAVRPFVSQDILRQNIQGAKTWGAVDTCIPSSDTIVHSQDGNSITKIPNRSEYFRGQTPQSFSYSLILQAHKRAISQGQQNNSDDCSLVAACGHKVGIVTGDESNIKITSELDLFLAEQLFRLALAAPLPGRSHSLQGKRFAITGATGGIGLALTALLEKEGASVIPIARTAIPFNADLTSFEATKTLFDKIYDTYGKIDGLINSIGFFKLKKLADLSPEEIQQIISTNLTSLIYSCKCAQIKEGGQIVNIASSAYSRGRKDYLLYSSAKAAVVNFTQGLAEERLDLKINCIVPQRTNTSLRQNNFPDEDPASLLDPSEVAHAIADVLKQDQLTGSIIEVRNQHQSPHLEV